MNFTTDHTSAEKGGWRSGEGKAKSGFDFFLLYFFFLLRKILDIFFQTVPYLPP